MSKRTLFAAVLATAVAFSASGDECSFLPERLESTAGTALQIEDLAWSGVELGVLTHVANDGGTLLFTRYSKERERLAADVKVASNVAPSTARLVWTGSIYGAFYRDTETKLKYRPLSVVGDPLGPEVTPFPNRLFASNESFDVAWDQDVFFLADTLSSPPSGLSISEIEPSGAVRSSAIVNAPFRSPVHIDVVITPSVRFVIFEASPRGGGTMTQIIRSERGVSPRLLGSSMAATSADGFWDEDNLVLIGRIEPISQTHELTISIFDAQGQPVANERTFLKTDPLIVPAEVLLADGEVVMPYVSTTSGLAGEIRVLRLDGDLATVSDSRMTADPRFTLAEPEMRLVWTGTSVVAGIYRRSSGESFLASFCPLQAVIAGPTLVKTGETVTFTSKVSGGLQPIRYRWERDTSIITGTGPTVNERFPISREYVVRLKVSDPLGQEFVTTRNVVAVAQLPPLAVTVSANPVSAAIGTNVTFTASAAGGVAPFTYQWLFADGRSFEGSSVTAAFPSGGQHSVSVTVTDAVGQTATAAMIVQINTNRRRPVLRP